MNPIQNPMQWTIRAGRNWAFLGMLLVLWLGISCNIDSPETITHLKLTLNDSLSVEAGLYDSVRVGIYNVDSTPIDSAVFHGPYSKATDSARLAHWPLGTGIPENFIIKISAFGKNGK